jgi:hypothetical protein
MDWTVRFLTGGGKVFAFHMLALATHALRQTISPDKTLAGVGHHALSTWCALGLLDGLPMDNDASFCGRYKASRIFR